MTDLFTAIGNFGFPIVVASYLLFRFEKKIEILSDNLQKNNQNIEANTQITRALIKALEDSNRSIKISNQQNGLS